MAGFSQIIASSNRDEITGFVVSLLLAHRVTALDYSGNTDAATALLSLVVFIKDSAPREVTHA